MSNYNIDLSPNLVNPGTEGSLDTSVLNGNSLQRTINGITTKDINDNLKIVGRLADGQTFNDEVSNVINKVIATQIDPNNLYVDGFNVFPDGSVIVFAEIYGTYKIGNFTLSSPNYSLAMIKMDPEGNVVWASNINGDQGSFVYNSAVFEDHTFVASCVFYGGWGGTVTYRDYSFEVPYTANRFTVIFKFDANGNIIWHKIARKASGSGNFQLFNIIGFQDKSVIVSYATESSGEHTIGGVAFTSAIAGYNTVLAKLDANGNILWILNPEKISVDIQNYPYDKPYGFEDGSCIFFSNVWAYGGVGNGESFKLGDFTLNVPNKTFGAYVTGFAFKVDKNGNVLWAKIVDEELGIPINGNSYLKGADSNYNNLLKKEDKILSYLGFAAGQQVVNIFELDSDGNFTPNVLSPGGTEPGGQMFMLDKILKYEEDYILFGIFGGDLNLGSNTISGFNRRFMARINKNKEYVWAYALDENVSYRIPGATITKNKNIVFGTYYRNNVTFGNNYFEFPDGQDTTVYVTLSLDGVFLDKQTEPIVLN